MIEIIKQKAIFLNNLSKNEAALFEYINVNHDNLDEVIQQYKPEHDFRPVNTLRFLIANEIKKGNKITEDVIRNLKEAIENRDVSRYYNLNESVKSSLANYKQSKVGMFPNWRHSFKVLFPFIHNTSENEEVKMELNHIADTIIKENQLEHVAKHVVSFQGSQNYGSDRVWVAIIPKSAPSVQYAYQIFFAIDKNGLVGGIHKGHNLTKQEFINQDIPFNTWDDYLQHTKDNREQWDKLNADVNFVFINDEKDFIKSIKKIESSALSNYFNILDRLKEDLNIQDEEKLVFSLAKNQLSFQVGKRYCLNVGKSKLFDFISNEDIELDNLNRETFSGEGSTYLYKQREYSDVVANYEEIKFAVENEIEKDNQSFAKFYDNSAFRRALFDKEYRNKFFQYNPLSDNKRRYWALGFNSNTERLKRFINESYWQALDYDKDSVRKSAIRARKLFRLIQPGDYILIKGYGGNHDLVVHCKAEGIAKDNETERLELKKVEGALYKGKAPRGSGSGNWHETILQIKREKDIKLLFEETMENNNDITKANYNAPLNQIFYGPPGTGKTYNTILEAAKIITQNSEITYSEALKEFNNNLGNQIEFVTFHQNYSYEDFIQGLRPETDNSTELTFNKSDGVFKKIADEAKRNYLAANKEVRLKRKFSDVFEAFTEPLLEGNEIEVKMKSVSYFITNVTDKSIEFRKSSGKMDHTLSIATLEKMYNEESTGTMQGLRFYYQPLLERLLEVGQSKETEIVTLKNYVIIIDEINRANISRVFGELITLIEKDKRLDGKIPIRATLPSGDSFIVPLNLYIIGTMNTADKSIALLDIALRRRFEFVPMYPKYNLGDKTIHKAAFLEKLNNLIVKSGKGHDFTIGHSYFMEDEGGFVFKNVINNKVIPLLLEYYMNDEVEVTKILNEALRTENYKVANWPLEIVSND